MNHVVITVKAEKMQCTCKINFVQVHTPTHKNGGNVNDGMCFLQI